MAGCQDSMQNILIGLQDWSTELPMKKAQKEVCVDEYGIEVVKLKGNWHVSLSSLLRFIYACLLTQIALISIQVHVFGHYATCPAMGKYVTTSTL